VPLRSPHVAQELKVIGNVGQIQLMQANIRFPKSVERAVKGSDAVINLVSILFEAGKQSFESVHVHGAESLVTAAKNSGIRNFVQVSAIGADIESDSDYARTKGEAEAIIRAAIPSADIMRQSYSFKALMQFTLETIDRKRFLAPVPWFAANMMGFMGEVSGYAPFVKPFLTRDQVKNLKFDNVVADDALGFSELGISLETLEAIVPSYLGRYRKYGQFHERRS